MLGLTGALLENNSKRKEKQKERQLRLQRRKQQISKFALFHIFLV
jgi:hypothetical protein